jgi:hypothetical protein
VNAAPRRPPPALLAALAVVAVVIVATSIRGAFTIDESNYLVTVTGARAGRLTVPGTEGLTPSLELAFFDPAAQVRTEGRSPIGSTAPPLYGFLATPFSLFGWRGLVALNTLAWLGSGLLVFGLAARHARATATPWLALVAYLAGGHGLEYAQGVWPHQLAAFLATAGYVVASRARDTGLAVPAFGGGVLLGLATGVRYQNLVFAGGIALALVLFSKRRFLTTGAFAAGIAPVIAACSYINHVRLGSWNPISKGPGYLSIGPGRSLSEIASEAFHVLWAKVVDYSAHPAPFDPKTGSRVFFGAIKKAWLQSSPWLVIALVALVLAWRHVSKDADEPTRGTATEMRSASIPVALTLASFAVAGFVRDDGICYSQRYFLEMVPLAAAVFALALERSPLTPRATATGVAVGALAAGLLLLVDETTPLRQRLELEAPLVFAGLLLLFFFLRTEGFRWALPWSVGAAIAWAFVIHAGEDLPTSRSWRHINARAVQELDARLPAGRAALVCGRPVADAFALLLLKRDLVIVDPFVDDGATLPVLARDLLRAGRRVFVLVGTMRRPWVDGLTTTVQLRPLPSTEGFGLLELAAR